MKNLDNWKELPLGSYKDFSQNYGPLPLMWKTPTSGWCLPYLPLISVKFSGFYSRTWIYLFFHYNVSVTFL